MKYIDRNNVTAPAVLAENDSKAANERAKVRAHYGNPNCDTYKFRAYKDVEVLNALNELFSNKCAYCGSFYRATSPTDIEHFRPKGRVSGVTGHKGYWWLASTWGNLLPSCILCNREQYNELFDITTANLNLACIKSGKVDHFPLAGPYRATKENDDIEREDPLLIDPTQRDPALYLTWRKINNSYVIVPLHQSGVTIPYARTSIQVYGLNRWPLVESRTAAALEIEVAAQLLASQLSRAIESDPALLPVLMPTIEDYVREFVRKKENPAQFAGMIEYLVDRELGKMFNQLQILKERYNNLTQ
ncbi:hypothetical protein RDT67_13555 [Serratia fonticola]|uniref:HNH nuclease domain-containing protein n=1 Tax=Serratia fonticola TaxID=47917 RepID=A0AAJ1YCD4_SERFO|nr:hypothetical protein [Serratia fonticola]MDQ9127454.1 hypothetical protein [Serratia fonticola]